MGFALPSTYGPGANNMGQGGYQYTNVPVASDWTLFNPSANTTKSDLTGSPGGVRLTTDTTGVSSNMRSIERAGTVSLLARVNFEGNVQNVALQGLGDSGLILRNSTSGRMIWFVCNAVPASGGSQLNLGMFQFSDPSTFNANITRINPFTLAVGTQTCRAGFYRYPKWMGIKLTGANVAAYLGFDDAPDNLFNIFTGSGAGTYVSGGGGTMDKVGVGLNAINVGGETLYGIDVHSAYIDTGL